MTRNIYITCETKVKQEVNGSHCFTVPRAIQPLATVDCEIYNQTKISIKTASLRLKHG